MSSLQRTPKRADDLSDAGEATHRAARRREASARPCDRSRPRSGCKFYLPTRPPAHAATRRRLAAIAEGASMVFARSCRNSTQVAAS
jgi:hypothetical protein